jgi:hypothetical protein
LKQLSYSKISFVLGKDCNIFCEGVGEVVICPPSLTNVRKYNNEIIEHQLTQIFIDDGNAVGSQQLIDISQTGLVGLNDHIGFKLS